MCSKSQLKIGADENLLRNARIIHATHIQNFYLANNHDFHGVEFTYAGVHTSDGKIISIQYINSADSLQPSFIEDKRKIESILDSLYGQPFYTDKYSKKWREGDIAYVLTEFYENDSIIRHTIIVQIGYYEHLKNDYFKPNINGG